VDESSTYRFRASTAHHIALARLLSSRSDPSYPHSLLLSSHPGSHPSQPCESRREPNLKFISHSSLTRNIADRISRHRSHTNAPRLYHPFAPCRSTFPAAPLLASMNPFNRNSVEYTTQPTSPRAQSPFFNANMSQQDIQEKIAFARREADGLKEKIKIAKAQTADVERES